MCQAFSCIITKSKKVYWKVGIDSHDKLQSKFQSKDKELKDNKLPPNNTFVRIEIVPANGDYLRPDKWVYQIDEQVKPIWLNDTYEKLCFKALNDWKVKVYGQMNMKKLLNPVYPFKLTPPKEITFRHKKLLKEWDSVEDSVWDSVENSVWDSVGSSVGNSVWNSVRNNIKNSMEDSVWDSVKNCVEDSVWAYISYSFPKIKNWKYIDKRKTPFNKIKGNPFRSAIILWKLGLVPSYDPQNKVWRLHGGPKAKILFEIKKSKLEKLEIIKPFNHLNK